MVARGLSFGAVAARYERFRPGYPAELVDRVLAYAGRPVRTALEIGAGTGKATRAFAGRGIAVTATDPDPEMLRELRRHLPPAVVTVRSAFEDLQPTQTYDLVFAAAALHWTDPADRWTRIAALLEPDGVFASFGGSIHLSDDPVEDAVRAARAPFLADDGVPSPDGTAADSRMQWPGTELEQSEWFGDVQQWPIERRLRLSARDYVGHLSTVSAYLQLKPSERQTVLARILQVLPEQVDVTADITLHLARRRAPARACRARDRPR
jgi:SAM-dependent methyltransferase